MPNDFLSSVEVGAGLVSRAAQVQELKQRTQQEAALFPYKMQEAQFGLQARALQMQTALQQKQIDVENMKGAAALGDLLTTTTFDDPDLEPQVMGLMSKYPHLA